MSEVGEEGLSQLDVKSVEWQKSLLDKIPDSTYEDEKEAYERRIAVLEHQNKNLQEELFYLREAVLKSYEGKKRP